VTLSKEIFKRKRILELKEKAVNGRELRKLVFKK